MATRGMTTGMEFGDNVTIRQIREALEADIIDAGFRPLTGSMALSVEYEDLRADGQVVRSTMMVAASMDGKN